MMARKSRTRTAAPRATTEGSADWSAVVAKKIVPDPGADPWALPSLMAETNGGGSAENVPGFDIFRAVTAGFDTRRLAGPTVMIDRPDGGFFSQGFTGTPLAAGSPASKPENVIGVDSRVLVTTTSTIPWRSICHLEVEYEVGPVGSGTGFLIGPKTVITAAHVLVDPAKKRKARRVRVVPGRNGTLAPYGYFVAEFGDCKVADGWLRGGSNQEDAAASDYAAIPIPDTMKTENQPTGERLGYFGLKCFSDTEARSKGDMLFVNNAGYPYEADRPYGTLWYNAGRVRKMEKTFVEYMVDTEGGQSGSPIYFFDEEKNQRYVIAIHTTGDFVNRGLRITTEVFLTLKKWAER